MFFKTNLIINVKVMYKGFVFFFWKWSVDASQWGYTFQLFWHLLLHGKGINKRMLYKKIILRILINYSKSKDLND